MSARVWPAHADDADDAGVEATAGAASQWEQQQRRQSGEDVSHPVGLPRFSRIRRMSTTILQAGGSAPAALSQTVSGMWANITEVARKRELEAETRRNDEAAHEDMVERLKIRVSALDNSNGVIIIGDGRRSNANTLSPNRDFGDGVRSSSPKAFRGGSRRRDSLFKQINERSPGDISAQATALAAELAKEAERKRARRFRDAIRRAIGKLIAVMIGDELVRRGHPVCYHQSQMRRAVYLLTLVGIAYSVVVVPFEFAFHHLVPEPSLATLDVLVRAIFGLDFLLSFVTTYPNSRTDEIVVAPGQLIVLYLRSPWAIIDVIAAVPLPQLLAGHSSPSAARLAAFTATLKILKMPQLASHFARSIRRAELLSALGMLRLLLFVLLLAHWIGCFFWFTEVLYLETRVDHGDGTDDGNSTFADSSNWLVEQGFAEAPSPGVPLQILLPVQLAYVASISSAFYFLAGSIDGTMLTFGEKGYAASMMMVGSVLTAFMVSQLSVLMQQMNASQRFYRTHMHSVQLMMEKENLPKELRTRVELYYSYLWHAHGTFELSGEKFKHLSPALVTEINIYLHRHMVQKVPFFATCSPAVVQAVVQRLIPEVYLEGDFVVHGGSINAAMYFITRGECAVLIVEPGRTNVLRKIKSLGREAYFGELSLLDENAVASAYVLAETFVDLKALYRADFDLIKVTYPDLIIEMHKAAAKSSYIEMHRDETGVLQERVKGFYSNVMSQLAVSSLNFSARLIQVITERVQPISFEAGDVIVRMREASMGIFFITEGTVQVMSPSSATGRNVLVRLLRPGDYFGELSMVHGQVATANVIAGTACKCAVLYKVDYEHLKMEFPELPPKLVAAAKTKSYEQLSPFVKQVALFRRLSEEDVRKVVGRLERIAVEPGVTVVHEGDSATSLVLIGEGAFVASVGVPPPDYVPEDDQDDQPVMEANPPLDVLAGGSSPLSQRPVRSSSTIASRWASRSPSYTSVVKERRGSGSGLFDKIAAFSGRRSRSDSLESPSSPSSANPDGETAKRKLSGVLAKMLLRRSSHDEIDEDERSPSATMQRSRPSCDDSSDSRKSRFSLTKIEKQSQQEREALDRRASFESIDRRASIESTNGGGTKAGNVKPKVIRSNWQQRGVKVLKEGEAFGADALLNPGCRSPATLRASPDQIDACTLYFLSVEAYRELCEEIPALRTAVERSLRLSQFATCLFLVQTDLLKSITDVPTELVLELARQFKPMVCNNGQVLIKKGLPAVGLFICRAGEMHCFIDDPADPTQLKLVKQIGVGGHCGELSLIEPGRETAAHVHASSDQTEVLLLTPVRYEDICNRFADFRQMLLASTTGYASFNFFVHCQLLSGVPHELIQAFAKASVTEPHVAGQTVVKADEPASALYFVQRGRLLKKLSEKENDSVELGIGEHFGWDVIPPPEEDGGKSDEVQAMTSDELPHSSMEVVAQSDCLLLSISAADVRALIGKFPNLVGLFEEARKKQQDKSEAARAKANGPEGGLAALAGAPGAAAGMGQNPLVESQLIHLQRTLDQVTTHLSTLETEINRARAAQERLEGRTTDTNEKILYQLRELQQAVGGRGAGGGVRRVSLPGHGLE